MLVLTRKLNEQIQIGSNITVSILKVKGSTVRVGIEAPRDVRVVRSELPRFEPGEGRMAAAQETVLSDSPGDSQARVSRRTLKQIVEIVEQKARAADASQDEGGLSDSESEETAQAVAFVI